MNHRTRLQAWVLASVFGCLAIAAPVHAAPDTTDRAQLSAYATELYRQGRWSAAYGRFARLADAGDVEAARLALHMLRQGESLYGTPWGASQAQIDLWVRLTSTPVPAMLSVSGD